MELIQEKTVRKFSSRIGNFQVKRPSRLHWHDNLEIVQPLNAPFDFFVDGEMIHAGIGDIVVIDEYTVHQFIAQKPDTKVRIVHIRKALYANQPAALLPIQTHIPRADLQAHPGLEMQLNILFDAILEEGSIREEVHENPYMYALLLSVYYLLMRHFPAPEKNRQEVQGRNEFYKITEYINAHYTEDISISSLCEVMFLSRKKLTSIFKKFSSTGINTYINMLRINKVNSLLDNGAGITEAAFQSGFQSLRTFSEVYRKLTGMTPSAYLKGKKE